MERLDKQGIVPKTASSTRESENERGQRALITEVHRSLLLASTFAGRRPRPRPRQVQCDLETSAQCTNEKALNAGRNVHIHPVIV